MVLSSAQVSLSIAAVVEGEAVPATPPGLVASGGPGLASSSCDGGGGDPPEKPWKGVLAELIYMCSGAVLLGVYIYTHLH